MMNRPLLLLVIMLYSFKALGSQTCIIEHSYAKNNTSTFALTLESSFAADLQSAWETITDYNNLDDFVTGMTSSVIISRISENNLTVEQTGELEIWVLTHRFTILLNVTEDPPARVRMTSIGGDFEKFDGKYEITSLDNDTVKLTWRGVITPSRFIPIVLAKHFVLKNSNLQFCDVISEIKKRSDFRKKKVEQERQ
mgnify:CR=1 FL=1